MDLKIPHEIGIAGAFGLWAGLHSLLADPKIKRRFGKGKGNADSVYGPPWYRAAYVLLSMVTFVPVLLLYYYRPGVVLYSVEGWGRYVLRGLQLAGALGAVWAVAISRPFRLIGAWGLWTMLRGKKAGQSSGPTLHTGGVYGIVRHPMYLFILIMMWANPDMGSSMVALFGCMTAYFFIGTVHEEKLLVVEFGPAYQAYKARVPAILPWPRPGRRSSSSSE